MCGKASPYRKRLPSCRGSAPFLDRAGRSPQSNPHFRKARGLPHIRRHSRKLLTFRKGPKVYCASNFPKVSDTSPANPSRIQSRPLTTAEREIANEISRPCNDQSVCFFRPRPTTSPPQTHTEDRRVGFLRREYAAGDANQIRRHR